MRRPPTYNSHFGAGFGKKHFKSLEKNAHKHINKIFAEAKKAHRAVHTKAGRAKTKAQRKREARIAIHAAHKEAKGGFMRFHKIAYAKLKADIQKKGAGIAVGAGTKVGAGWGLSGHWTAGLTKTQIRAEGKRRRANKTKVGAGCKKCDYDK